MKLSLFFYVFIIYHQKKNRYLDKDGKGIISKETMKEGLVEIGIDISDEELKKIFDQVDEDGSEFIEYQEFIRNTCDIKKLMTEPNLKNAFQAICGDKNIMTGKDIKKFAFHDLIVKEQTLNEYFDSFGMKYEDSIGFDDFFNMMKNNQKLKEDENMEKNDKNKKFEYKGVTIDEKIEEEENGGIGDNEEVVVENGSGKFKIRKDKEEKKENENN